MSYERVLAQLRRLVSAARTGGFEYELTQSRRLIEELDRGPELERCPRCRSAGVKIERRLTTIPYFHERLPLKVAVCQSCGFEGRLRATDETAAEVWNDIAAGKPAPEPEPHPYGYCPVCGAPGVSRERRPGGNDRCEAGHTYPSRDALKAKPPRQEPLRPAEVKTRPSDLVP